MKPNQTIFWISSLVIMVGSFMVAKPVKTENTKKTALIGSSSFADFCDKYNLDSELKAKIPDTTFNCFAEKNKFVTYFLEQFEGQVKGKGYTDLILYAGLNGLNSDSGLSSAQATLTKILNQAKQDKLRVIVVGAQPFKGFGSWTPEWAENIKANNAWIAKNSKVDIFIDIYSVFNDGQDKQKKEYYVGSDYLHPNEAGQKVILQMIASKAYGKSGVGQAAKPFTNADSTANATVWNSINADQQPLTQDEIKELLQKPRLKIRIPGLNFSDFSPEDFESSIDGTIYLHKPFFSEYIVGIYRYGIVILGIVCTFFIMSAGLRWALPNAGGENISEAKQQLARAITGLMLGVGSYVILYTINPTLVSFKGIGVAFIQPKDFSVYIKNMLADGTFIKDPNFHYNTTGSNATLSDDNIISVSEKLGLDQCLLWSFAHKESGGKLHAIGDDENYAYNNKPVNARRDFLLSGKKYSGATFTPPASSVSDWEAKGGFKKLNNYAIDGKIVKNDDVFDFGKPPDYGIDWRFSHGISFLQITIFPMANDRTGQKIDGPNGPEWARKVYGRWYTVTDLLNPDTSLEAGIRFMTHGDSDKENCSQKTSAAEAFKCMSVSDAAMGRALDFYEKCSLKKNMTVTAADKQKYSSSGSH